MPGGVVAQTGAFGRPQPRSNPRAQAPQSTVINGQTYLHTGQNAMNGTLHSGVQAGTISGNDGSIWVPMARDDGGAGGSPYGRPGAAAGPGGELEDFNFNAALLQARTAIPGPLAPAQLPARVQGASPADAAAAQAAEFGRAKDRIGHLGRGSMTALNETFDARGMGGSGMEGAAAGHLLSDLQGQQGEVIRDQAIQNLVRQRQVEDRNYAGDINQRGQDIGFTTTTRGQDSSHEIARHQMQVPLMQLIAANRRRRLY